MAIEKKSLKDMPASVRAVYQKAMDVIAAGADGYGVELLKGIVQQEPGLMDVRAALRDAERKKMAGMSGLSKVLGVINSIGYWISGRIKMVKNPLEALSAAEEALSLNLYCGASLKLLQDAGKSADALFIELEAMELMVEGSPTNEALLNALSDRYKELNDGRNFLKIRQRICALHPDDLELKGKLREAAAIATMEEGGWSENEDKSFIEKIRKTDDKKVDSKMGDRIIRADEDIRANIQKYEAEISAGNTSVDFRRKLAELYMRSGQYEKSIEANQYIVEKMGTLDPAIDKSIEKAKCAILKEKADAILKENAPGAQEKSDQLIQEIYDYRLGRYEERVKLYPQDLQLRYELAELYWEGKNIEKAMEQFQLAQRNPQKRLLAIVYLGRCFHEKGQNDMAIAQFTKAIDEMPVMDKVRMNTLYYMGITYDAMGKEDLAVDCFKQIYAADITYRDVAERMSKYYEKQNQK